MCFVSLYGNRKSLSSAAISELQNKMRLATGAPTRTPLGELTALSQTPWLNLGKGNGRGTGGKRKRRGGKARKRVERKRK